MAQPPHVETPFTSSEKIRDIVTGMSDGLTAPFAPAAGLINTSKTTPLKLSPIYSAEPPRWDGAHNQGGTGGGRTGGASLKGSLLFVSSTAFTVIESAMAIIF